MKKFFKEKGLIIGIVGLLLVVFIIGGMYSRYVSSLVEQDATDNEQRYYDDVVLDSLEYNLDYNNFAGRPFIATFTYENEQYSAYLDKDYLYVEMISGEELNGIVFSAVKHHAEQEELVSNRAYFTGYNETTRTVEMEAIGFVGTPIEVTIVLNDSLDGIESYSVTSYENYDNEYNTGYTGAGAPTVENQLIDDYINQTVTIDADAGASIGTGVAIRDLLDLLDMFIDSLNGGN